MLRGKSILCTICARGGSKGVPGKNVRPLLGKPMIAWTVEQARNAGVFEHIVVSTDSDEIAAAAEAAGASAFFRRSAEMASDTSAKLPVVRDAFIRSEEHFGTRFDINVDLDATSPLRLPEDIRGSLDAFLDSGWDNLITGMPARRSPYFNLVEAVGDTLQVKIAKMPDRPIVRRQDAPRCFDMNASIYVWRRDALLAGDVVLGPNTGIFIMPEERSIDIDSEVDFRFVEFLLAQRESGDTFGGGLTAHAHRS